MLNMLSKGAHVEKEAAYKSKTTAQYDFLPETWT